MDPKVGSVQEATATGLSTPKVEMSDQDLVDQIQELAREIESMDDVSSVASDSQRLSPSAKPTVLWAKKRFPRQGIRSTRKVGQQRKLGFGATTRVEIGQLPMRQGQINGSYPEPWEWTQNHHDENRPLIGPLTNAQGSSQTRWPSSAASLSDESEYSIGTIAAPIDQESISDNDEQQPVPTKLEVPQPVTSVDEHCGHVTVTPNDAQFAIREDISYRVEDHEESLTNELYPAPEPLPITGTTQQQGNEDKRAYKAPNTKVEPKVKRRNDVIPDEATALTKHWDHHTYTRKLVPARQRSRLTAATGTAANKKRSGVGAKRGTAVVLYKRQDNKANDDKDPATSSRSKKHTDGNNHKRSGKGLCQSCREPLQKQQQVAVKWSAKEWDTFWTKVSCAASDIRTLREHGLDDNEACVAFLCSFKELINKPFL